jgi:hypothetical protein
MQLEGVTPQYRDPQDRAPTWRYLFRYDPQTFQNLSIDLLIKALQAEGVPCEQSPYVALHQIPLWQDYGFDPSQTTAQPLLSDDPCNPIRPYTEQLAQTVVGVPYPVLLGIAPPILQIIEAIEKVRHHATELVHRSEAV